MNTVKIEKQNTKMVAHRGLSGLERENTCMAFVAAGNRSYWGIEVEAYWELAGGDQYTSDSELNLVGQMLDEAKVTLGENRVEMDLFLSFL